MARPRQRGKKTDRSRRSGVIDLTPQRGPLDWKLAVRRYREGASIVDIAREAGYSLPHVRRGLLARGVKLRRRVPRSNAVRLLNALWRGVLVRADRLSLPGGRPALCKPWRSWPEFREFATAAGYRPGLALVRLDPKRGFERGNVRFVARRDVARFTPWVDRSKARKLVTAFGQTKGLMEWVRDRRCRVSASVLSNRLKGGTPPEAAIATPPAQGRRGLIPNPAAARAPSRPRVDWEKAQRLYERGLSPSEIGRLLGATRTGIRDALRRNGVALRPRGRLTVTRDGILLGKVWSRMRAVCSNPHDRAFAYHGAKGARVCREWEQFEAFHRWAKRAGWKPGLCLTRLQAHRGYSPDNCRFVTPRESSLHASAPSRTRAPYVLVTAFGETRGVTAWSRDPRCKVSASTLAVRLRQHMRPEDALTREPLTVGKTRGAHLLTAFGETKSLARWLRDRRCKVTEFGLRDRLARGLTAESALTTLPWRTSVRRG